MKHPTNILIVHDCSRIYNTSEIENSQKQGEDEKRLLGGEREIEKFFANGPWFPFNSRAQAVQLMLQTWRQSLPRPLGTQCEHLCIGLDLTA